MSRACAKKTRTRAQDTQYHIPAAAWLSLRRALAAVAKGNARGSSFHKRGRARMVRLGRRRSGGEQKDEERRTRRHGVAGS